MELWLVYREDISGYHPDELVSVHTTLSAAEAMLEIQRKRPGWSYIAPAVTDVELPRLGQADDDE